MQYSDIGDLLDLAVHRLDVTKKELDVLNINQGTLYGNMDNIVEHIIHELLE